MTSWDYRVVWLERTGRKQDDDFLTGSSTWVYTPWVLSGTNTQLQEGLQQLGREGWELVGVVPGDAWTEKPSAPHAVRPISYALLFKRPLGGPA